VTIAIRDDLAGLQVPTLIVWGTADQFFDVAWARWLAATIPGTVRCVELEGAKLFFPLERPPTSTGSCVRSGPGPGPRRRPARGGDRSTRARAEGSVT